mgnify:CR=1 FL=1
MPILYLTLFLVFFGIIMQYSASSTIAINKFGWENYDKYLIKHLIRVIIGIIAMMTMYNFKFKWLKKYSREILILSWAIMLFAYIWNDGNTRRFLVINGINIFTTSDFTRFAIIIFTANFIATNKKNINNIKKLFFNYIIYALVTLALILKQPDLSSTFIIFLIIISMLIIGGLKIKYVASIALMGLLTIINSIIFIPYMKRRFENWWSIDPLPYEQISRSKQALHNGGFWGNGFGESIVKEGFMAEGHTDFILPIIGEEIGFIGILFLFACFLGFYSLAIRIAKNSPDIFSCMLSIGIAYNVLYYFLINAGYVVGIIPPTGLAIPFISYGGSHTLFTLISIGVLLNISKYCNIYKNKYLR